MIYKTQHRVTIWANGAKGVPVSCTCGWKAYAKTRAVATTLKREHVGGQA